MLMRKGERNYADYRCTCAESEKGLFIAMPSKKAMDGEYRDIAHPINSGTREKIQSTILGRYEEALEEKPEEEVQEA